MFEKKKCSCFSSVTSVCRSFPSSTWRTHGFHISHFSSIFGQKNVFNKCMKKDVSVCDRFWTSWLSLSISQTHTLTHSLVHTLSYTLSRTHSLSNTLYLIHTLSHTLIHTLSYTHSLSHTNLVSSAKKLQHNPLCRSYVFSQ